MAGVIDMRKMRYINLFSKIARVPTTHCFMYNSQIVFAVPEEKVSFAIGRGASNVKRLREVLGRKVKVVAMPRKDSREGIIKFIEDVVSPIEFSKIEIREDMATISANRQSKAALIGRNRVREKELSDALKDFFSIAKLKIA